MVVGSRLRLLTLAASALAAVAFAAAAWGRGCGTADDSPDGAVRAFVAAARAGDRDTVYQLLGPETRARLDRASKRATQLAGGPRRFGDLDLIGLGRLAEDWSPAGLHTRREGGRILVDVKQQSGEVASVPVVEVDGHWRIEIPGYLAEGP